MLSLKKVSFGLMMTFMLLMGTNLFVDASFNKTIVSLRPQPYGYTQYYQNTGSVMYNVSYINTGTSPITVRLSDTLPTTLMPIPLVATCDGTVSPGSVFSLSQNLQTLFTNYCTLQPGSQASMTYSVMILSPSFASITNTATVSLFSGSSIVDNQTTSTTFFSFPVLSVEKTFVGLNPQKLNDLVTFKIKLINSGASVANNITVTDNIPNGFEFVSSTLPGSPSVDITTNTVSRVVPTVAANSVIEYSITIRLATSLPGAGLNVGSSIINTARISTGTTSLPSYIVFGSPSSQAKFVIAGTPSVRLTKSLTSPANGIVLFSGSSVSYTITVTNTGTDIATGSIVDILPTEFVNFSSSIPPSTINGTTWTWTGIVLAPGATRTLTINGVLGSNYPSSRIFTNTAVFSYDPNTLTGGLINNGVATGLIQGLPNLVLTKSLLKTATAGQSGDVVVYSLTVTNSSPTPYTGARCLVDTIPSQISLTNDTLVQALLQGSCSSSVNSNQISFSGTGLPQTIILTGVLNNNYTSGTTVNNIAQVRNLQGLSELISSDNNASASFTVGARDIALTKTVGAVSYTGTPGTLVTYTLSYTNNGTISASGVILTDNLPNTLVYNNSTTSGAVFSGSNISRNIGTLNPGQSGSISFTALISGYVEGGLIANTASLTSVDTESNLQNNTSSASFTVIPGVADVRVAKSIVSQGTYVSGTQYVFRFDIANIGGTTATGIVLSDILPSLFTYVSGSTNILSSAALPISFTRVGNTVTSDGFALSPGQSGFVLMTVVLNTNILTTTSYTNTGTVTSRTTESSLVNNTSAVTATITAPVISCSGLNYTITAVSPLSNPIGLNTLSGVAVGYTYSLTNNLPLPLETLSINTTWPLQVSIPSGLNGGVVASVSNIPTGSGVSYTLAGVTNTDGISTISTPASFTARVAGGQSFTCPASSVLSVSQTCGNGVINTNLGEQCENYNGSVLVGPTFSFNAATQACDASCKIRTTKITNCAFMDVSGVVKNACVDIAVQPENPVLTIKKFANNSDAQDTLTAVPTTDSATVSYRVVITNTSAFPAYNVRFTDPLPSGVAYVASSISPTTVSYDGATRTLSGNLGTLAAGASTTLTFNVTTDPSANGAINNIARVDYTDSLGAIKPQLSDPAVIVIGGGLSSICGNGVRDGSEQCDIGNLPGTIGNYLDSSTNFPSGISNGKICNTTCQITEPVASRCGDGIVGKLEQCDLGNNINIYNGGFIGTYLDSVGQLLPSGIYNGKRCSLNCLIESKQAPSAPACWYTDSVISIMKDEILPFAWDIELGKGNVVKNSSQCNTSTAGFIVEDSLKCTFEIYNRNEEGTNGLSKKIIDGLGCKMDQWGNDILFKPLYGTVNDLFVEKPRGTYKVTLDDSIIGNSYGEYKLSLKQVDYDYCDVNGRAIKGNPYARVCQVNFAVTDHYLMQKGTVSTQTNSKLENYFMLDGGKIFDYAQLNSIDKLASLSTTNLSSSMRTLTNNLISKYEKIAVNYTFTDDLGMEYTMKKIPGKDVYIMNGNLVSFRPKKWNKSTTLIVKGDINIIGDTSSNLLIIATGKVKFNLAAPTISNGGRENGCKPQVIRGIIIAQGGFERSDNNGYKNTNLNNPRCRKGNLQVYGVLVGNDLDAVVKSRRSHLEHWFTFERNGANITVDDPEVKAERRDEIYKGASVYIEQNPSLWRDMPPGADEFLKSLNVSRS